MEQELIDAHNQLRARNGLAPLIYDANASKEAYSHSNNLANGWLGIFGINHIGFSGRAKRTNFKGAAENVAAGQSSVSAVMRSWISSAGHYKNILGNFKYIGVGIAKDKRGNLYWTTLFGNR